MRPHPLRARRVLIVAPHPDDETIGAWGLARRLIRLGAAVQVAVVSDGGASHPGSRRWPRERLVRERRWETVRAAATIGLGRTDVSFCGLPDGALATDPGGLQRRLGRIVRRMRPALIVGPVMHDAHADHRAVAAALAALPCSGARRLGYQVWPERRVRTGKLRLMIGAHDLCHKRRAVRCHRTQTGMIRDAEAGFAMTSRHLRAFVRPIEWFEVLG